MSSPVPQWVTGQRVRLDAVGVSQGAVLVVDLGPSEACDMWCIGTRGGAAVEGWTLHAAALVSPDGSVNVVPSAAEAAMRLTIDLAAVPPEIERLSVALAAQRPGARAPEGLLALECSGRRIGEYQFSAPGEETALLVADVYRKDGWRVAAVGQGYVGGPDALFRSFGVASPAPTPPPVTPPVLTPAPPVLTPVPPPPPPPAAQSSPAPSPVPGSAVGSPAPDAGAVDPALGFRPEWFGPLDALPEVPDRPFLAIVSFGDPPRDDLQPEFDAAGQPVLRAGEQVLWIGSARSVEVARKPRGGRYEPEVTTAKMSSDVIVTDRRIVVSFPDWRKGGGLGMRLITATDQDARASTLTGHLPLQAVLQLNSVEGMSDVVQVFWVFHSGSVGYTGVGFGRVTIEVDAAGGALARAIRNAIVERWRGETTLPLAARHALDQTITAPDKADIFGRVMDASTEKFVLYRAMGSGRFLSRVDGVSDSALPDQPAMLD